MLTAVTQRLCSGFISLKGYSVLLFLRSEFQLALKKYSSWNTFLSSSSSRKKGRQAKSRILKAVIAFALFCTHLSGNGRGMDVSEGRDLSCSCWKWRYFQSMRRPEQDIFSKIPFVRERSIKVKFLIEIHELLLNCFLKKISDVESESDHSRTVNHQPLS